jgi:hypothetical protein
LGADSIEDDADADAVFVPAPDAACDSDEDCDDGNSCTTDTCDVELGCVHEAIVPCCAPDQCEIENECFNNDEENPDNSCAICLVVVATDDWSAQDETECDDESACTSGDTCVDRECVGVARDCSDGNHCTDDICDEESGECSWPANSAPCSDGNACTVGDACENGSCADGKDPLICDDSNTCTSEVCDPAIGCVLVPDDTQSCDDGDSCTITDMCVDGICAGLEDNSCDDDNLCTADFCGPDGCDHSSLEEYCGDTNVCTDDGCDPELGCVYGFNTNPCDDGSVCTIADGCGGGVCRGTSVYMEDENPCTDDGCDSISGPFSVNNDDRCDDDNVCTVGDACTDGGCVSGTDELNCDDGNVCTDNACDSAEGCVAVNNEATCDDGNLCTDGDSCESGICIGAPTSCDDGRDCTIDLCDLEEGCTHRVIATNSCRPNILVDTPVRAATVTGAALPPTVTVAGSVVSGGGPLMELLINDISVPFDLIPGTEWDYAFSIELPAMVGANVLRFSATDDLGTTRDRVQTFHWSTEYTRPNPDPIGAGATDPGLGIWLGQSTIDDSAPPPPTDFAGLFKIVLDGFDLSTFFDPGSALTNAAGFNIYLSGLTMAGNTVALEAAEGGLHAQVSLDGIGGSLAFDCTDTGCELAGGDGTGGLTISSLRIDAYLFMSVNAAHELVVAVQHARTSIIGLDIWANNGWTNFLLAIVEPFIIGDLIGGLEADLNGQLSGVLGPMVGDALSALAFNLDFELPRLDGATEPDGTPITIDVALGSDFSDVDFQGDGVITVKPTYEMGIAILPECATGQEYDAGLCYTPCAAGYDSVGPVCWQQCPAGMIDDGAFCRIDAIITAKRSYGRGVGTIPNQCDSGRENIAGLCYTPCASGWYGELNRCYRPCAAGYIDDGLTCRRPPQTINGDCWAFGDCPAGWTDTGCFCSIILHVYSQEFYNRGVGTIPNQCGSGRENDAGLCYPNCAGGYDGVGPVCWEYCPAETIDDGAFCRIDVIINAKDTYGRGVGTVPTTCPDADRNFSAGLCYQFCPAGWDTSGSTCSQQCATGSTDLGDACQASGAPDPHGGALELRAAATTPADTTPYTNDGVPMRIGCGVSEQTMVIPRIAALEIVFPDDTLNQILHAAWRGGLLEFPVDASLLGDVDLSAFGVTDLVMDVTGMLAPLATDCGSDGELRLHVGDLRIDAALTLLGTPMNVIAFASFDAPIALTAGGGVIEITVESVENVLLDVSIVEDELIGFEPALRDLLNAQLVPALTGLLGGGAPLTSFPLPSFDVGPSLGLAPGTLMIEIEPLTTPPADERQGGNTVVYGRLR